MGWRYLDKIVMPVVKQNGHCYKRYQWKYCPYWRAKLRMDSGRTLGFRCGLFSQDKKGTTSLPECNAQYGQTYEGRP